MIPSENTEFIFFYKTERISMFLPHRQKNHAQQFAKPKSSGILEMMAELKSKFHNSTNNRESVLLNVRRKHGSFKEKSPNR